MVGGALLDAKATRYLGEGAHMSKGVGFALGMVPVAALAASMYLVAPSVNRVLDPDQANAAGNGTHQHGFSLAKPLIAGGAMAVASGAYYVAMRKLADTPQSSTPLRDLVLGASGVGVLLGTGIAAEAYRSEN